MLFFCCFLLNKKNNSNEILSNQQAVTFASSIYVSCHVPFSNVSYVWYWKYYVWYTIRYENKVFTFSRPSTVSNSHHQSPLGRRTHYVSVECRRNWSNFLQFFFPSSTLPHLHLLRLWVYESTTNREKQNWLKDGSVSMIWCVSSASKKLMRSRHWTKMPTKISKSAAGDVK